jgi:para-nitrobenzyl esterase
MCLHDRMSSVTHPEVVTKSGPVRGLRDGAIDAYRGIPYAAPPTGANRWRPPNPLAPWTATLDAVECGAAAPQVHGGPLGGLVPDMEPTRFDEDCLTLNVWTPSAEAPPRAVLVWLHGGAFSIGSSSLATYDATWLAANEEVVVVSVNYRLGALGFLVLDLPGTSANCGLLDMVAALGWIRDNIAAFGGDPERVTVFGESAGGGCVLSLLSTPAAHGLFQRAIVQSGATDLVLARDKACEVTAMMAAELGIDRDDLAAWQAVKADDIIAAQAASAAKLMPTVGMMPLHPVADGDVMPATWQATAMSGQAANVPLIIGTTRDEMALFGSMDPAAATLDDGGVEKRLRAQGHPMPAVVIDAYRSIDNSISAPDIWSAITTDMAMWMPALRYAAAYVAHQPDTWMYRFDWESAQPGLGACHGIDIPFPFDAVERNGWGEFVADSADAHALARTMQALWAAFARGDDPTAPDAPHWPRFSADDRATLVLDRACTLANDPRAAIREVWGG